MSLKALIGLANKPAVPLTPEERERNNIAFQERMRGYNREIEERHKRMEPSQELLNRLITI